MVSQFSAMFPSGNMQSSAVLLLQIPKISKGKKNSLTICYQIPFIFVAGLSFTCLWFSESTKNTRVSLTTLPVSVVAKQAVGHSDRKGQAVVGHIHFQLRNFHYTIYA